MRVSRVDRINLRCRCTGETPNMVRRHLATNPDPLLPDAASWIQRVLEMQMLFAAHWANYKRHKDHTKAITSVRPRQDLLCLTVTPEAVPVIVAYFLSPASQEKGVQLRPNQHHIEVQLRDPISNQLARIRLLNHGRKSWQSIKEVAKHPNLVDSTALQRWRTIWDTSVLDVNLTVVSSATLRRIRLWQNVRGFRINGGTNTFIDWAGDLSADTLADILTFSPCQPSDVTVDRDVPPIFLDGKAIYFKLLQLPKEQYSTERIEQIASHWVPRTEVEPK